MRSDFKTWYNGIIKIVCVGRSTVPAFFHAQKVIMKTGKSFTKEERIEQLKLICDSIKENAAEYIGNYEFPINRRIIISFPSHEIPTVTTENEHFAEKMIKEIFNG